AFLITAEPKLSRSAAQAHAKKMGLTLPLLQDDSQWVSKSYGFEEVGEAVLIDPKNWEVILSASLLNENEIENFQQALRVQLNNTAIALAAATGKPSPVRYQLDKQASDISYTHTIAPLLQEKCVDCHRPEGIGPWAMTSYEM